MIMTEAKMDVVVVHLPAPYEGWHATFKTLQRISARVLIELESESAGKRFEATSKMILKVDGWKDDAGNAITDPLDAPIGALDAAAAEFMKALNLPNA